MRGYACRTLSAVLVLALVLSVYLAWARPAQLRHGATDAEVARGMPGDALSDRPTFLATRAITIDATPATIWPWLVQLGYGRAGFYGYDILENLGSPRGMRSAARIDPALQGLAVGDALPLSALGGLVVHAIAPNQYLVWSGATGQYPGAFTWALYPIDAYHTRLVSRIQWRHHWTPPYVLALDVFTEFADHLAVRKILVGVKDRAEGRVESFVRSTVEFGILVWALLAFVVALALMVHRPLSWSSGMATLAAGTVWLGVWYAPASVALSALANVLVVAVLWSGRAPAASMGSPTSEHATGGS